MAQRQHERFPPISPDLMDRIKAARQRAAGYLHDRQSDTGGFCFYRSPYIDQPNLHDTWHAVAALALLGIDVPRKDVLVDDLCAARPAGLDALYFIVRTLDLLQSPSLTDLPQPSGIRALPLSAPPAGSAVAASSWLTRTLKTAWLRQRFGLLSQATDVAQHIHGLRHDGGYGDKPNLCDTGLALRILALLGAPAPAADTRAFVERKQLPGYGFTLTDDSRLCNVDVLYGGLQCCAMLSLAVRHATDILRFGLGCQAAGGGFAGAPGAAPNIALTHRALQIFGALAPGV